MSVPCRCVCTDSAGLPLLQTESLSIAEPVRHSALCCSIVIAQPIQLATLNLTWTCSLAVQVQWSIEALHEITLLHSHGLIDDVCLAMVAVHFNVKHRVRWLLQQSARQKVSTLHTWSWLIC